MKRIDKITRFYVLSDTKHKLLFYFIFYINILRVKNFESIYSIFLSIVFTFIYLKFLITITLTFHKPFFAKTALIKLKITESFINFGFIFA